LVGAGVELLRERNKGQAAKVRSVPCLKDVELGEELR